MLRNPLFSLALCLAANLAVAETPTPIPVEAFFGPASVSSAQISPGGRFLATMVSDNESGDERRILAVLGTEDRKVKYSFKVGAGLEIWNYWWANDERVLIATATQTGALSVATPDGSLYAIDVDKTQAIQLLGRKPGNSAENTPEKTPMKVQSDNFTHITARESKQITSNKTYFFDGIMFVPQGSSRHVLVRGWADDSARVQALDVDVYSGEVQEVLTSPTDGGGLIADGAGNVRLAWGEDRHDGTPRLYYRDAGDSSEWKDLSATYRNVDPADDDSRPLGMSQDGKSFYWQGRTPDGTMGLFSVNPQDMSQQTLYSDAKLDTETHIYGDFADNKNKILAVETFPGLPELHVIDPKDSETAVLLALGQAFPGQQVEITSATSDGTLMVIFVSSDRNPGDYYLFNVKTLKADYLFSARDQINPDKMSPMQPVVFNARDGLTLHGYLTTPSGAAAKNLPLILLPHGGPSSIRDFWGWDPEAQFFASRGYAVLQVNFRGSGGYGMRFQDLGYRNWATTMQDDLADSVQWAVKQGIADSNRICIYGASYGGYAALENVIRYPSLYKCAVGYVGVYDLTLQQKYSDTRLSTSGKRYLDLALGDDIRTLKENSPAYHADKINVPVLIAYGGKDRRVVPDNAKELLHAMDAAGKKYESLFDPYEDHGFKKPQDVFELYNRMDKFFDRYIGLDASKPSAQDGDHASPSN